MTSEADTIKAAWQQTADVAERYKMAENATRPFAKTMVQLSDKMTTLKTTPVDIFDLGCGTGAVEAEIYASVPKDSWADLNVLAADVSAPMLAYLDQRISQEGWSGVKTAVVDGAALSSSTVGTSFAHIFVGFAIFAMPVDTTAQLARRLAPGGTLAVSTWAHLPWFRLLREACARMDDGPSLPTAEQLFKFLTQGKPWNDAAFVRAQLEDAGLEKVEIVTRKEKVDCGTPELFMSTFDFVMRLLSLKWPEEKREAWKKEIGDTMKGILVEEVGGPDKHISMEFEGIVGVGLKQ